MPMDLKKVVNTVQFPRQFQKNAITEKKDELKLELITYEKQILAAAPKEEENLKLELIYDGPDLTSSDYYTVEAHVATLKEQKAQMEARPVEHLRGALGLQTRQLEAFRKHEEQTVDEERSLNMELLRGASGLQKTQLEAIRKLSQSTQEESPNQKLSAKPAAARSRL